MNELQKLCNDFYLALVKYEREHITNKEEYRENVTRPVAALMLKIHRWSN